MKVVKNAFFVKPATSKELIAKFVNLAGTARIDGILALESARMTSQMIHEKGASAFC
jgi:flagellar motor component MotA